MLQIGDIILGNPVAVAPMSGVTDLPFRRVAARAGAGMVVSEMVASAELAKARPDVVRRTEGDPNIRPFVIQLAGADPRWMAEGARIAADAGADIIDINMGCPARQVTGKACGSALMRTPLEAQRLIEATVKAVTLPVTLKMRLGWDRSSLNAPEIARAAEDIGVRMITVHGRTRNQFYKGAADWKTVALTKRAVRIPVLVNGDIQSVADARSALLLSGCDGVMVGRAMMGRPWLAAEIAAAIGGRPFRSPSAAEQAAIAIGHFEDMLAFYETGLGIRVARKHLAAYIEHAPGRASESARKAVRSMVCQSDDPTEVIATLTRFYDLAAAA
jgi:nifR3 family TIM-barrel protein